MSLIQTRTADQRLILISSPKITSGNQRVDSLNVITDDTWIYENLTVKAHFHTENDEGYFVEMSKDGGCFFCNVPDEVETLPGLLYIGIYGEANGGVIKTTNEIHITIAPGTELVGAAYIDWEAFKADLITALNEQFDLSLPEDADNDTILAAIGELQNSAEVRAFWVEFIARKLMLSITPETDDIDIELNVDLAIDALHAGDRNYRTLASMVARLVSDHIGDPGEIEIEPAYMYHIPVLDSYMTRLEDDQQVVITALSNLYLGG